MKKWGNMLLAAWLVITGLVSLTALSFRGSYTIQALLAIGAGVALLLADWSRKFSERAPNIVLGIWLIVVGLIPLFDISFHGSRTILALLALIAGVMILIRP